MYIKVPTKNIIINLDEVTHVYMFLFNFFQKCNGELV